jgi:hypothetical protein
MKNRKWFMAATAMLLVALCLLAGCKTTVPVSYTEPARLDLSGITKIAVDSDNSLVADNISQKLSVTGKYTVASETELSEWRQWKRERETKESLLNRLGPVTEVSSADLVKAYSGNAARADSTYLEKAVKVTAVIKEIGKSSKGNYFIRLEGAGNDSVDVFFAPFEVSALAAVDKGQSITIVGECRGYNVPDMEDTAEILRILGAGRSVNIIEATFPVFKDYEGPVDAVISLHTDPSVQDGSHIEERPAVDSDGNYIKNADGKTVSTNVTVFDRRVTTDISYQVARTRDRSLIGEGTKSAKLEFSNEAQSKLPDINETIARTINGALSEFTSEIVPTQRSISLTLAKADSKEAKKEMSGADKLVKAKNYTDAAAAYGEIYAKYKNFAAGYNQAVLTEVTVGTEAALGLMEALYKETSNPIARSTLEGMQSRNVSNKMAAAQLSK